MKRRGIVRAVTGLAAGALLTASLLGVLALGSLAKIPSVPFVVFDWLVRVLPGSVVNFGLDLTIRVLDGLGFNIKNTAKTAEQVLAIALLFVAGMVIALLFFVLVRTTDSSRIRRHGSMLGAAVGLFSAVVPLTQGVPASATAKIGFVVWVLVVFVLWGWGIARLYELTLPRGATTAEVSSESGSSTEVAATPAAAEARSVSRRQFIIQVGGLVATIVVVGAGVGDILRAQFEPGTSGPDTAPITFPNEDSPVQPAPGTRPEYTAVPDHFRVDIDLTPPDIDGATWRLNVGGLVRKPLLLTLDEIKSRYRAMDQFVTLACISNMLGGPLIGTTLWTGAPLREVLDDARSADGAHWAHIVSADGYDEEVDLQLVQDDPRIMLTYAWDGQPLTAKHGFPLRICVPDRYGMKQPKWITGITLTEESNLGYWVRRNWEERAEIKTTSVIDTVATKSLVTREGRVYIPIGGIAHAGAKGISKVEIQIDDAPWEAVQLRQPLSDLTWVIWRYDWPFTEGTHWLAVRAYDGQGRLQVTEKTVSAVGTAITGLFKEYRTIEPIEPPASTGP
jgi:DMSO/TMAO reductase YedYZ molybdopterin-dependent catalytic subunit